MVLFEGALCLHFFSDKLDDAIKRKRIRLHWVLPRRHHGWLLGYFAVKGIGIAADNNWHYLLTGYGMWYLENSWVL
jgi:hypothetical protein